MNNLSWRQNHIVVVIKRSLLLEFVLQAALSCHRGTIFLLSSTMLVFKKNFQNAFGHFYLLLLLAISTY